MARISGVDLPREKRVEIGLTYIYGIGLSTSQKILAETGVNPDTRVKDLTEEEVNAIRNFVAGSEGDRSRTSGSARDRRSPRAGGRGRTGRRQEERWLVQQEGPRDGRREGEARRGREECRTGKRPAAADGSGVRELPQALHPRG